MARDTHNILKEVVETLKGPPNWCYHLEQNEYDVLHLVIILNTVSNYDPEKPFAVGHWRPVPIATYNKKTWQRWIYEESIRVMHHELGEGLVFDGKRPFAPCHGPGWCPYHVHDNVTDEERRTMQDGSIRPAKSTSNNTN